MYKIRSAVRIEGTLSSFFWK